MDKLDARDNNNLDEYEKIPCKYCGKYRTYEGHDGCLGELIGIANACCGHGNVNKAYVQFLDGTSVNGKDAMTIQNILKKHSIMRVLFLMRGSPGVGSIVSNVVKN